MSRSIALMLSLMLSVSAVTVNVPACTNQMKPNLAPFHYTTDGSIDSTTVATMCHENGYLIILWENQDFDIVSTYQNCNDPLFNEDAVEFFVSSPESYPNKYFQMEVSPRGQLFIADITNKNLNCSGMGTQYYPCNSVTYKSQVTLKGWNAYLKIDLKFIGRGKDIKQFKGNLYRIDKFRSQSSATRYLAYNPANNSPACFHQPLKFVDFKLV